MDTLVEDVPSVDDSEYARAYGEKIGQGAFRAVYRIKGSNWAYKFNRTDTNAWFKKSDANAKEIENYIAYKVSLPEGVNFPEMVMLSNGAIAVRFVNGVLTGDIHADWRECECPSHGLQECWVSVVKSIDISDLHGKNVMYSQAEKKIYIIDIGEFGR